MNQDTKMCPKCGGAMEKGMYADSSYWVISKQRWVKSLKQAWFGGSYKVDTYACTKCGFLESYLESK